MTEPAVVVVEADGTVHVVVDAPVVAVDVTVPPAVAVVEVATGIPGPPGPAGGGVIAFAELLTEVPITSGAWVTALGVDVTFDAAADHLYQVAYTGGLLNGDVGIPAAYIGVFNMAEQVHVTGTALDAGGTPGAVSYLNGQWVGGFPPGPVTLNLGAYSSTGVNQKFLGAVGTPAQLIVTDLGRSPGRRVGGAGHRGDERAMRSADVDG